MAGPLTDKRPFIIGVIGDEQSFAAFLELFRGQEASRALADMGLTAVTAPAGQAFEAGLGIGVLPVYPAWRAMLAAHPAMNTVVELTADPGLVGELRRELPLGVTLVEQGAARLFLAMFGSDQLWLACKLDLMQTHVLLKTVLDQLTDHILFLDPGGRVLDLNRAVYAESARPRGDFLGQEYREVLQMGQGVCSLDDARCPFEIARRTGEASEATYSLVDQEGRMRYFRLYCHPIRDDQGRPVHYLLIRRDITQRTYMEQRLQQSERLAAVGELSTYIAHEIRNPLFAISGFANSLLRMPELAAAARDKAAIILEESKRLDGILKSILNFARPTQARNEAVELNRVVRETMELLGMGCQEKGIAVDMDLAQDMAQAKGDPECLKQCLINLVKNAMEAMPGGGRLTIRTGMTMDFVFLEVQDTGVGIAPEIRDRIFNPFFSTKGKGAGLGLAMTRKIMEELGGRVDLSSTPGQGTCMRLSLPPALAMAPESAP